MEYIGYNITDDAAAEPVTLSALKDYLKIVDDDTQDNLLNALLSAAREAVEKYSGIWLKQRTVTATLPLPGYHQRCNSMGGLELPFPPVLSVSAVTCRRVSGNVALDSSEYEVELTAKPWALLRPAPGCAWPDCIALDVNMIAGYAAGTAPQAAQLVIMMLVAEILKNPEITADRAAEMPNFKFLFNSFAIRSF